MVVFLLCVRESGRVDGWMDSGKDRRRKGLERETRASLLVAAYRDAFQMQRRRVPPGNQTTVVRARLFLILAFSRPRAPVWHARCCRSLGMLFRHPVRIPFPRMPEQVKIFLVHLLNNRERFFCNPICSRRTIFGDADWRCIVVERCRDVEDVLQQHLEACVIIMSHRCIARQHILAEVACYHSRGHWWGASTPPSKGVRRLRWAAHPTNVLKLTKKDEVGESAMSLAIMLGVVRYWVIASLREISRRQQMAVIPVPVLRVQIGHLFLDPCFQPFFVALFHPDSKIEFGQ